VPRHGSCMPRPMPVRPVFWLLLGLPVVVACSPPNTATPGTVPTPVVQTNVAASPAAIGASPAPSSPIQFVQVQVTATDALLELQNTGGPNTRDTLDLDGWAIQVGSTRVILPNGTRVAPGQSVLIHSGPALSASPLASPSAFSQASPVASPSAITSSVAANVTLSAADGATLRQALQPGVDVDLVDPQNTLRSRYTLPRT